MALPRNSRRTASIPTTDRPPAPGTARRDDLKDNTPAPGGHPSATLLVKGPAPEEWAVRRPSRSYMYMRRLCAVALSVGTRAICCKPDALTDDGRQVPNVDLPSSDREVVHDLHRRKLAHCSSSLAAGDGRKRDGGIARRAVGAARRRQLLRQR